MSNQNDPDPDQFPKLADLNVDKVRAENDHVDNRIAELEGQVSDLQSDKATLEEEKADLEEKKNATEQLLADFREDQREEQMNRIRSANEAVSDEDEVDLSTLEDASVDQLTTVADMLEKATAATGGQPSNANRRPNLNDANPNAGDDGVDEMKQQIAQEEGLGGLYEKATTDGFEHDHQSLTGGDASELARNDLDAAMGGDQ